MAIEDEPRLGCGHSIDRIWATIDQPPSAHEEQCEQCQTARARLKRLSEATLSLRDSDRQDLALKPRTRVKENIMAVARAEVRRGARVLLVTTGEGTTEISEQAIGSIIRIAATAIPGVHARRCRIEIHSTSNTLTGTDDPPDSSASIGDRLIVNLRVAAAPGIDIPRTMDSLRQRIATAIPACVGISAGTINITVEDLYDV